VVDCLSSAELDPLLATWLGPRYVPTRVIYDFRTREETLRMINKAARTAWAFVPVQSVADITGQQLW
jgi:hypothetical protein